MKENYPVKLHLILPCSKEEQSRKWTAEQKAELEKGKNQPTIETLQRLLTPMGISLAEFFNEDEDVSYLNDREKELVAAFRAMPDDSAELYLQLGKKLNQE